MKNIQRIISDQYTLRLLTNEDLNGYYQLIDTNRKRLEDFFAGTVAITQTLEDTKVHLKDVVSKCEKDNYFPFIVTDVTGELIASLQVKSIDWTIPKAELGYYVDSNYEGKGIVTKAVDHIIDICFNELGFNKLYIRTSERNIPSKRIAEKCGFTLEGTIRRDYKTTSGELIDTMYFGLLKEEYK